MDYRYCGVPNMLEADPSISRHGVSRVCTTTRYCDCYRYPYITGAMFKEYLGDRDYSQMDYSHRRMTRYNFMWAASVEFLKWRKDHVTPGFKYVLVDYHPRKNYVIHPNKDVFEKMESGFKRKHPVFTHKQETRNARLKPESAELNALQKSNQSLDYRYVDGEPDEMGVPSTSIRIGKKPQFTPSLSQIESLINSAVNDSPGASTSQDGSTHCYIKVQHTDFERIPVFTKEVKPVSPRYIKDRPIDYVYEGRIDGFNDKKRHQFVVFAPKGCGKTHSCRLIGGGDTDELHHANEGSILRKDVIYSNNVDVIDKRTVVILPDFKTYLERNLKQLSPVTLHDYSMIINRAVLNRSNIIFSNSYVHDVLTRYYPTVTKDKPIAGKPRKSTSVL